MWHENPLIKQSVLKRRCNLTSLFILTDQELKSIEKERKRLAKDKFWYKDEIINKAELARLFNQSKQNIWIKIYQNKNKDSSFLPKMDEIRKIIFEK